MKNIPKFESILGVKFNNENLLLQALVHRSYLNEHPKFHLSHNERLEFLGDAVLELIVTEYLYKNYNEPEGQLTNWRASLVNATMLANCSKELKVGDFLLLSKGEAQDTNEKAKNYILANAFESVTGAIYLDQGWKVTEDFILRTLIPKLPHIIENELYLDAKSKFQELAQENFGVTPSYEVVSQTGPDHAKIFEIALRLGEELVTTATGTSKQEGQMKAAQKGLELKGWLGKIRNK